MRKTRIHFSFCFFKFHFNFGSIFVWSFLLCYLCCLWTGERSAVLSTFCLYVYILYVSLSLSAWNDRIFLFSLLCVPFLVADEIFGIEHEMNDLWVIDGAWWHYNNVLLIWNSYDDGIVLSCLCVYSNLFVFRFTFPPIG